MDDVIVVGGGIGGLTLALMLHERGIRARVYEAAPAIEPVGYQSDRTGMNKLEAVGWSWLARGLCV